MQRVTTGDVLKILQRARVSIIKGITQRQTACQVRFIIWLLNNTLFLKYSVPNVSDIGKLYIN